MNIGYVSYRYYVVYPYRPNSNKVFNRMKILNKAYCDVAIRLSR